MTTYRVTSWINAQCTKARVKINCISADEAQAMINRLHNEGHQYVSLTLIRD